jgi:hypothetical protein
MTLPSKLAFVLADGDIGHLLQLNFIAKVNC